MDPSSESFQAAAASADWSAPDFYQLLTAAPGLDSWPITATTFVLMPKTPKNAMRANEALGFFKWALSDGKKDARVLNYVSLPDKLVDRVRAYWNDASK